MGDVFQWKGDRGRGWERLSCYGGGRTWKGTGPREKKVGIENTLLRKGERGMEKQTWATTIKCLTVPANNKAQTHFTD